MNKNNESKLHLTAIVFLIPFVFFAQSEQSGIDFNVGLVIPSNQVFEWNYLSKDTVDLKPVYESPSFVFGINYTQALANKFSLLYGLSYTRLDHDFELRSIRVGDSFPSNSDIYQQGSASGFFNYHVFGFSLGLSKNFTLFKQFAIAGSLSLNYQVSKSNWTSEAGSFDNFVEQDSTFTILNTAHWIIHKLSIFYLQSWELKCIQS